MKMTITRVLAEINLTEKKISKLLEKPLFAGYQIKDGLVNKCIDVKEFNNNAKATYQAVKDLIQRRKDLKKALIQSNAITTVTIGNNTYTVADAIERKNSLGFEIDLLSSLKNSLAIVNDRVDSINLRVNQDLHDLLKHKFQSATENVDLEAIANVYKENNYAKAVDPLKVADIIVVLENQIDEFKSEVDLVLSESNSITTVEI